MNLFTRFITLLAALTVATPAYSAEPPIWAFDAGPSIEGPNSDMGKELIEINARIPYFPGVSKAVMGGQKFRPAFGPISWRMGLEPNSVKILFIGQDGTHIAEAAGRPATAGFGGRAHDLANYFGVDYSAAFINTYAFTIRGQYGDRGVPYLKKGRVNFTSQFLDNELWLMSQGQASPITQWRNELIDWIIRNNKDSLRMIVTFGGSARDSISSYIESKANGDVGTRTSWAALKTISMPEYKLQYAGGNNNFPVPIDKNGKDIYASLLGKKPNYVPPFQGRGKADDQAAVKKLLVDNFSTVQPKMVFANGGVDNSGLVHPAQLGGYDIRKIKVNGNKSISLKGLELNDGTQVSNDILVVDLPHPTYLSMQKGSQASKIVGNKVKIIQDFMKGQKSNKWYIEPDDGLLPKGQRKADFFLGENYQYKRGDIGQEYYDFGTPGNRMVAKSDAKRIDASTILLGTREDSYFSKSNKQAMSRINQMKEVEAAEEINPLEMFISINKEDERFDFDPGPLAEANPGESFAELMKTSLYGKAGKNLKEIFARESVVNVEKVADFGHYRGVFEMAKAVVIADPHGWDDIITARALTGLRGQYLQGLMNAVKDKADFGRNHLVLKTVPFGMEDATNSQWSDVLELTENYRDSVLEAVLDKGQTDVIITDGENAKNEVARFLKANNYDVPVVNIERTEDNEADMLKAAEALSDAGIRMASFNGKRANIPSSHLSYYARVWEGTSGDRVITSPFKSKGLAFAEVVPNWVVAQVSKNKFKMADSTKAGNKELVSQMCNEGLPLPGEKPSSFLKRKAKSSFPSCK